MMRFKVSPSQGGPTLDVVGFVIMVRSSGERIQEAEKEDIPSIFTLGLFAVFWEEGQPNRRINVESLVAAQFDMSSADPYVRLFGKYIMPRLQELGLDNYICVLTLTREEEEEVESWFSQKSVKVDAATLIKRLGLSSN
jgi:hypothetical protein